MCIIKKVLDIDLSEYSGIVFLLVALSVLQDKSLLSKTMIFAKEF